MEKQLLLNSVEVVERKTNCVFLLSLCGSFECTLATPVLIFERGAKIFFRCISAKHHTSHNVCEGPWVELILTHSGDLQSLCDVVKRLPNLLKIGFQARFCPNFIVELEAEIPPKNEVA